MIKELLSTALLAVSMGSLKPDSPKRAFASSTSLNGTISVGVLDNAAFRPDISFSLNGYSSGLIAGNSQGGQSYAVGDGQDDIFTFSWDYSSLGSSGSVSGSLQLFVSDNDLYTSLESTLDNYVSFTNGVLNDGMYGDGYDGHNYILVIDWYAEIPQEENTFSFDININVPEPTIYYVTKNLNNCRMAGNTDYGVPDSFTNATLSNPYTIWVIANEGYFFKRDGSSFSFSSGVVVSNVDYGANPQGQNVIYTEQMFITFSMPAADVSLTITANAITLADANGLYNQGYQDAKSIYENTNQFAWLKNIWSGMAGFFAIEILPNISLGFLAFAPLLVVAIIAIVRIMKHD